MKTLAVNKEGNLYTNEAGALVLVEGVDAIDSVIRRELLTIEKELPLSKESGVPWLVGVQNNNLQWLEYKIRHRLIAVLKDNPYYRSTVAVLLRVEDDTLYFTVVVDTTLDRREVNVFVPVPV